ncbi:MAG TPA: glycosyltransferase [Alphaproteobacteria bacterium]|nr:glycosyltransferase [Alphaproteobacteria bacterium]
MNRRLLLYVQSLLGIGHLARAARLARAFAAAGWEVDLVSGGMPVAELDLGGAHLVQLPPLSSKDESFTELVDDMGKPPDAAWCGARRERLLAFFAERRPDVLMLEMFPFGRRQMRFELLPLLAAARAAAPRPLVVSSTRDIVQARRKPGRAEEAAALVEQSFDLVLVHGDPRLVRFEESFPCAAMLGARLCYTGYVAPPPLPRGCPGDPGWDEVVVSAGGGAVGAVLLASALAARPRSSAARRGWRLLAGRNLPRAALAALAAQAPCGVVVERARADFPTLLANCRMSISQAGYNTVMEIARAGARAVLVPYVGRGETEQTLRAERLAARGLVQLVPEAELSPERLAAAVDRAEAGPPASFAALDLSGAAASVAIVSEALARHPRGGVRP